MTKPCWVLSGGAVVALLVLCGCSSGNEHGSTTAGTPTNTTTATTAKADAPKPRRTSDPPAACAAFQPAGTRVYVTNGKSVVWRTRPAKHTFYRSYYGCAGSAPKTVRVFRDQDAGNGSDQVGTVELRGNRATIHIESYFECTYSGYVLIESLVTGKQHEDPDQAIGETGDPDC